MKTIIIPLLVLLACVTACIGQNRPPNVLFIAVDDLRPELGAYGNTHVKTPNIDRLAKTGVTFTRAYVQQALCNPSRASLLTGLRPDSIRVWDLQTRFRDSVPDVVTLPQQFMQHGYHTAAIGKIYHNTIPDSLSWSEPELHIAGYPFDPDAVYRHPRNIAIQEARKAEIIASGRQARHIDRYGEWYLKANATEIVDLPDSVYYDGAQTDVALDKLKELRKRNQPFFFAVGYYRPHLPFNAPKKYWDMYNRKKIPLAENPQLPRNAPVFAVGNMRELRGYADFSSVSYPIDGSVTEEEARLLKHGYFASVSYVDAQVGQLLDALETLGLKDNTIVVLWGDHGYKLGEHNSWCKMTNYEIDTRAPLIIRDPRRRDAGLKLSQLVEFVDIYPSLCELAGVPTPTHLQGTSFVPLFKNPKLSWKQAAFSQYLREGIWAAPDGIEYMGYAMRTERYRYVKWIDWKTREQVAVELYDHSNDPGENENLAPNIRHASLIARLEMQRQAGWRAALPKGKRQVDSRK